jgi:hypothetical protein
VRLARSREPRGCPLRSPAWLAELPRDAIPRCTQRMALPLSTSRCTGTLMVAWWSQYAAADPARGGNGFVMIVATPDNCPELLSTVPDFARR